MLGVETSCDETSAAVLGDRGEVLSLVIHSQDVHQVYGGVVPELAARDHLRRIEPVVDAALQQAGVARKDLAAVAATATPGLIGALLVGFSWARAQAYGLGVPLIPVHHMEAHLFGPVLENPAATPPFVALLVSGGHTLLLWVPEWGVYELMGSTRDDAVGEAFDKVGKLLDLPYPGGPQIEALALEGDPLRFAFPRPMLKKNQTLDDPDFFDFSFSGLKTAVAQTVAPLMESGALDEERPHVAAAFQEAALDVLVAKTLRAVRAVGCPRVLIGGGVSANRGLQGRLALALGRDGTVFYSSPRLAMDNGAMVARAGQFRASRPETLVHEVTARAPVPGVTPWTADSGPAGGSAWGRTTHSESH
ncbi:MAG: tRNA (adenosine(37)-N6)-threonylcarbamoyltransferase complex transferase subunit TsaD [Gemmatimonadetes bacterium]|nr:tRNA (adenosine(37)-N6)-threonylcarbamoyltransferase complex transferase subunit TsaD [Gemmatimonadota bacterium]